MKIITLLNEKGGVGKTTLAVTLASGLADRGYRVLIVDSGEQGHVAAMLRLREEPGFFMLLEMQQHWKSVLRQVPQEAWQSEGTLTSPRLFALPSDLRTRALPFTLKPDSNLLRNRLAQLHKVFDVVVIDTDPAASLLHLLIYRATDYVLYPTRPEALSLNGLDKSLGHLANVNADRKLRNEPLVQVLGIVPTMYRKTTAEHEINLGLLHRRYPDAVWDPIAERVLWSEACAEQRAVFAYKPYSDAAAEANLFIDRVEREVLKNHATQS